MEEENTEASVAEVFDEPDASSTLNENPDIDATDDSPQDENENTSIEDTQAEETDENVPDEQEDKEGTEEHDRDDLEEPVDFEQKDTEETEEPKEDEAKGEEKGEESETPKDETEDVKEQTDTMQPKESDEATTEVPVEDKPKEAAQQPTKKDTVERKDSMDYDLMPRYTDDLEDAPRASGDFLVAVEGIGVPVKFYKYMEEGEEEEEEEIEIRLDMEEEVIRIDRAPYYDKYIIVTKKLDDERLQNNILQKKLATFFKRRRMEHVLKETDEKVDTQLKYGKKLDAFGELMEIDARQRNAISQELENLREARETKFHKLQKLFEDLQAREKEIGTGLINTQTGNPIPDKVVERLIRLQKSEINVVSDMRLKFIKLKYLVAEKQEAINIIDKIDEDLYLMDFEQLKVENRGLADKIEERDEELTKLRSKCQTTIQILAHIREKTAALESDIDDLKDDLSVVDTQSMQVREQLNMLKQQRDYYRNMSNKLRSDSGLLIEIELLRDMEESMGELQLMTEELENMKAENKIKAQQIRNIRKNIEFTTEGLAKKSFKIIPQKASTHHRFYKGRPSLFTPTLAEDAFKHLKYFKPKPSFGKTKKNV